MKRMFWLRGLKFAVFAAIAISAIGAVVMTLWNALVPALFGGPLLGFWQALGLLALSRLLVGSLRGGHRGGGPWRARMAERWAQMSDEDRAKFREGMRQRCGGRRAAEVPPIATP